MKMSRILSINALTKLRKELREESDENIFDKRFRVNTFDFSDIELISSSDYPNLTDETIRQFYNQFENDPKSEFELAKILHENIRIDRSLAANNLYWVYLNLNYFLPYIKERWLKLKDDEDFDEDNEQEMKIDRFFLALESSHNSLIKSPIAGLWWAIEITKNELLEDKYHYSKIFLSDRNLRDKNLGTYQLIRKQNILFALLDFYQENKDANDYDGNRIGSEAIAQQMSKTLNQIGGLTLLSFLTKEEISDKLKHLKNLIIDRAIIVKKGKVISREKIAIKTNEEVVTDFDPTYYLNLNSTNGEYRIMDSIDENWEHNIDINLLNNKCFIVTTYKDGKIKKTNLSQLSDKVRRGKINRPIPFKNGVNINLSFHSIESIHKPVLFGVFYSDGTNGYVKIMDTQDENIFRSDNGALNQEGKKVVYSENIENFKFCIISIEYLISLQRLIKGASAKGVLLGSPTYSNEWAVLKQLWPELFEK